MRISLASPKGDLKNETTVYCQEGESNGFLMPFKTNEGSLLVLFYLMGALNLLGAPPEIRGAGNDGFKSGSPEFFWAIFWNSSGKGAIKSQPGVIITIFIWSLDKIAVHYMKNNMVVSFFVYIHDTAIMLSCL